MGLSAAEKQRRYRERRKSSATTFPVAPVAQSLKDYAGNPEPMGFVERAARYGNLRALVEELYAARASYTTWRRRLLDALEE